MRTFLIMLASFASALSLQAQKATAPATPAGFRIPLTITPLKNCRVYIGCYYGKFQSLVDSAWVDNNSNAVFKGNTKLPGGMYFLVLPQKAILPKSDFLVDGTQHFSLQIDTLHPEQFTFTGSPENILFQQYTRHLNQEIPRLNALRARLQADTNAPDAAATKTQLAHAYKALNDYRDSIAGKYPESMLTLFLQSTKSPEPPPAPTMADGKKDSLFPARYAKDHYWDNMPLHDDRLLRTPVFDNKLDDYFRYYVVPDADSLIQEVNYILLSARSGKDMFKYLLGRFTDKYINPEIMGHDKVFVYLFNQYYSKGDTAWLTAKQKEYIFNRAYSLMANQIGEPAAALDLLDTTGRETPMYTIKAPFTFVLFWDPNCGHCKEVVPRVDSMYEAKWKSIGVKVYAVNVDEKAMDDWKKYIREHHLNGWLHAYQPKEQREADNKANRANFRQLYDVFQTPTMYLLDSEKRIIGKRLTIEQFDEVMQAKLKVTATLSGKATRK
jgi:thiol-disulfide isomerase/thioredoxin